MMSLEQLFGGRRRTCKDELDNLAKTINARQAWARLTLLQRCRIEIEAVGDVAEQNYFVPDFATTLERWLEVDEVFAGLKMETQVDGKVTTIKVWGEEEEFQVRVNTAAEERGVEFSAAAKLGESTLEGPADNED